MLHFVNYVAFDKWCYSIDIIYGVSINGMYL